MRVLVLCLHRAVRAALGVGVLLLRRTLTAVLGRIDAAQHGRKRSAQKKHANAKRGTNGTVQAKHENPHAPKGKGGQGKSGKGGSKQGGGRGKQGKRRG